MSLEHLNFVGKKSRSANQRTRRFCPTADGSVLQQTVLVQDPTPFLLSIFTFEQTLEAPVLQNSPESHIKNQDRF